jgi:hypothetical protein
MNSRPFKPEGPIRDARNALGENPQHSGGAPTTTPESSEGPPLTLHVAIAQVLHENGNRWMSANELADAVNGGGLYRKRDGSRVEANQVHARTNNYKALFEKTDGRIRLRDDDAAALLGQSSGLAIFKDDDAGFFDWLAANPDGFFINTERTPTPRYLVLHRPGCRHFKGGEQVNWTREYIKVCSAHRDELEDWATTSVGGEETLCRSCFR